MKYVRPDYFDSFLCIADKCRHSCCIGWEIEIDRDSVDYYKSVSGELGDKLRRCTSAEPEPHFILDKDERCPFLNKRGLCELILGLGEGSLCDICTEHPRFYNVFSAREEYGLGMCCEAVAELLLNSKGHSSFICVDDGADEPEEEADVFALREKIFNALCSSGRFEKRMDDAAKLAGGILPEADIGAWTELLLSLERLDEAWTDKLLGLKDLDFGTVEPALRDDRYVRIAEYIIFRYFASAESEKRAAVLAFAYLSAVMICALDVRFGTDTDHLRMFSAEIEYSDENVGAILDKFL